MEGIKALKKILRWNSFIDLLLCWNLMSMIECFLDHKDSALLPEE